jgi:tetratricopeptide (TPR) repeat protein
LDAPRPPAVLWIALATAAGAALLYLPSLGNGFVNWDDADYVTGNALVQGPFDVAFVVWSFTTFTHLNWHPFTWLSLGLDHAAWGLDPFGFHLSNTLLYAANVFVVVVLAWRLLETRRAGPGNVAAAALVGALFASHPLHVESVAWVSERKDLLYGLFFLLAVLAHLAYARAQAPIRRRVAYAAALVAFVAAALSKPMAVTLPVVLVIVDVVPLGRIATRTDALRLGVLEKLPHYAVSLVIAFLAVAAQRAGGALDVAQQSLWQRLWVAERAVGFYLAKLVAPFGLAPYYPHDPDFSPLGWEYLLSLVVLVGITTAAVRLRRRVPAFAAAWAYFVVSLLPVLGLVQVGGQSAADRYMYLAIGGPLLLLGAWAARAWEANRSRRVAVATIGAVVLVLLGWRSVDQMAIWKDSLGLWSHVLIVHPEATTAHFNLAQDRLTQGDTRGAERSLRNALETDPQHAPSLNELARVLDARGSVEQALELYRAAVAADPNLPEARYNLALILEKLGDLEAARPHYEAFVILAPPRYAEVAAEIEARLKRH